MEKTKLLFMGADTSTEDAIRYAQASGIYTIVTDYQLKEKVPAKQIADEDWMIDVKDIDALEHRCRQESVNAIYAGNQEFCIDQCKALCKRLGLPFYANNDGWKATRDKIFYKKTCQECGLATPRWIELNENTKPEEIGLLKFPVVVKPTDSCAQQGLSIIYNPADVMVAYQNALAFSQNHVIIAEEYIGGDEIVVFTYIHDGKIICLSIGEHMMAEDINGRRNFCFVTHSGRYNQYIRKEILPKFEMVAQKLGCKEGACTFQCVYQDGILYNFELGYRLDGFRTWRHHRRIYGVSELELMIDLAMGIIDEKKVYALSIPSEDYHVSTGYVLWVRPGTVQRITGVKELRARTDVILSVERFKEGDIVLNLDNIRSLAYAFLVYAKEQYELDRIIKKINETLHMYDEKGKDMLIYHNTYYENWVAHMGKDL